MRASKCGKIAIILAYICEMILRTNLVGIAEMLEIRKKKNNNNKQLNKWFDDWTGSSELLRRFLCYIDNLIYYAYRIFSLSHFSTLTRQKYTLLNSITG